MKPPDLLKMNFPPVILIYGGFGTGKTGLVSQLEGAYAFDFDRGMRTAATLKDKFFDARQKIEFDVFRETNPFKPVMFVKAKTKLREIFNACAKGEWDRDAIIVDSLTGLCDAAQLYVQSLGDRSNPTRDPMAKMEIQNWLSLTTEVDNFFRVLQATGMLIVVTAHVDSDEEQIKGEIGRTHLVSIFPSSATHKHGRQKIGIHFDEIWYADKRPAGGGKINYRITGTSLGVQVARTRSSFTDLIHNETGMVELMKKIGYHYRKEERSLPKL